MSRTHQQQKRLRYVIVFLVAALTLLLAFGLPRWGESAPLHWLLCYLLSVNAATWITFAYDKRIAGRRNVTRVPENALFLLAVAGGLPSTLLAMQALRHKRAKASFKWKLVIWSVAVYGFVVGVYVFFGNELNALAGG